MSIQVNGSNNLSYHINATTSNSNLAGQSFSDVLSDKSAGEDDYSKLDDEDQHLYTDLKKAGVDLVHHTLEFQKQHIKTLGFPPLTAPSNVRKAWREMEEKMSSGQKQLLEHNMISLMCEQRAKMGLDIDGLEERMQANGFSYANFVDDLLNTAGTLKGTSGFDYSMVHNSLTDFKENLESEKSK